MGNGKPRKFFSNISNNEIIPDENFPDYANYKLFIIMGGVGYSYNGYKGRYNENYKGCLG